MSKVVHLSDDAHNLAKDYCSKLGVKMSDWVADLITRSIRGTAPQARPVAPAPTAKPAPVMSPPPPPPPPAPINRVAPPPKLHERAATNPNLPKKKPIVRLDVKPQTDESGVPAYAAPPFWARAQKQ